MFMSVYFLVSDPSNANECQWSNYGPWSKCSVSCGDGVQQRKRVLIDGLRDAGSDCSNTKEMLETRMCHNELCAGKIQIIQWKALSVITVNDISCLKGSDFVGPIR